MSRKSHSIVSLSIARIGFTAGAALVLAGVPVLAQTAVAAEAHGTVAHPTATDGERLPPAADIVESILGLASRVNGWQ
ncbi:hypothetical protein ACWCRD_05480 [Streptomyces sp. NPDC002092]